MSVIRDSAGRGISESNPLVVRKDVVELYGKSTDTKPTSGIKVGSTFFAVDTQTAYMFDGATWVVM